MVDWFTGEQESWLELYEHLQQLPSWGKFHSAMQLDEDYGRELQEQAERAKRLEEEREDDPYYEEPETTALQGTRSQEGYTPELRVMQALDEHMQTLIRVQLSKAGVKQLPNIARWPTPFSMFDRLELEAEAVKMEKLRLKAGIRKHGDSRPAADSG